MLALVAVLHFQGRDSCYDDTRGAKIVCDGKTIVVVPRGHGTQLDDAADIPEQKYWDAHMAQYVRFYENGCRTRPNKSAAM